MKRLIPVAVLVLLAGLVTHGAAEKVHSRLLQVGEVLFPGYADLRSDPVRPDCDPNATPAPTETPSEDTTPAGDDDDDTDTDLLNELFGDDTGDDGASAAAQEAARERCKAALAEFEDRSTRITPGLRFYRGIEKTVAAIVRRGLELLKHVLALLILLGGVIVTLRREHIALRSPVTPLDDRVAAGGQLLANVLLAASWFAQWRVDARSGLEIQHATLPLIWMTGFGVLAVLNVIHLISPREDEGDSSVLRSLLCVPLYATMGIIAGLYFLIAERHPAGLAIHVAKLTEHALLYLHVALYVWTGMLLRQTRLATRTFDLVRPWKLPPEILAVVVVAASAFPTAYSGASGIFVIAAGALIYDELRRAGARHSLAMATTAMSGSIGVVLRPCLLVVVVASLNKQVTTDQLFGWGWKVYALTAVLFLIAALVTRQSKTRMAPLAEGARGSWAALRPLVGYAVLAFLILAGFGWGLGVRLDEHTAPVILPVLLLALLVFDRRPQRVRDVGPLPPEETRGLRGSLIAATTETTQHIGALLMLMGLSVCLGGVIERSNVMALVPESLGSPLTTMAILVVVLVIIGMIMDPYGAVILVTAAIAPIAERNGIAAVHFWMVVLVAFELGYLTPPVALNHLLARSVVDGDAITQAELEPPSGSFYRRHERLLLPISVMATALLLVSFVPLLWMTGR